MDLISIFVLSLAAMVILFILRTYRSLRAAETIVKTQFQPCDPKVIEQGFDFFKGEELRRYTVIVRRIRQEYGHQGFKVGHMAWLMGLLEKKDLDANTIKIPSFIQSEEEKGS